MTLREDGKVILQEALAAALPDAAVNKALEGVHFKGGKLLLVAVGKAAWQMAYAAYQTPDVHIDGGVVITKYGHTKGPIGDLSICEAGHPVPDENTFEATERVIEIVFEPYRAGYCFIPSFGRWKCIVREISDSERRIVCVDRQVIGVRRRHNRDEYGAQTPFGC